MTPIVKDQESVPTAATPVAPPSVTAKTQADAASRPQPVALEVPVSVNGARTVEGSDKREPFSESSHTVLVFGHGAVIRISAVLAPGQLIFLTNEKTKKEVVCQVVKSKSDGSAVGYVELRFTEPAPGFWGMRFPSDTVLPQAAQRPTSPAPAPIAPKAVAPVAAKPVSPAAPVIAPPPVAVAPPPAIPVQSPKIAPSSAPAQQQAPVSPAPWLTSTDSKPSAPIAAPNSSTPSTEELKQQAARLQEQLSSLLFTEAPKTAALPLTSAKDSVSTQDAVHKVLDLDSIAPPPAPTKPVKAVPPAPKTVSNSLAVEEIKIPSWLAPLARETDSKPVESSASEDSSSLTEVESALPVSQEEALISEIQEASPRPQTAVFGGQLLGETSAPPEAASSGSKTGLFIGIAATLLLVAGGVWYSRQPGNAISGILSGGSPAVRSAASSPAVQPGSSANADPAPTVVASSASVPSPEPVAAPPVSALSSAATSTPISRNSSVVPAPAPAARNTRPVEQPRKPVLGDVKLATPVLNRDSSNSSGSEPAPAIDVNQSASISAPVSTLGSSHRSGPAAPIPVGGDVKPAKLIKAVSPLYPDMARTQRVSGNVQIDAVVDAEGNVSSMKVLSGPPLLHAAALQALKQWKYQPAELDGKPTTMHLTVTIQFRAQ